MTTYSASQSPSAEARLALVAAAAAMLFVGAWAMLHAGPFDDEPISDTPVYEAYGDGIANGEVPYRDFELEYPPGALPLFVVPSLMVGPAASTDSYTRAFELVVAACGAGLVCLTLLLLLRLQRPPRALAVSIALVAVAPLALGSVIQSRFDLWPALVVTAAVLALVSRRELLGSALVGLAVAVKLYAAVLAPLVVAWLWRRHGRRAGLVSAGVLVGVLVLVYVPFLAFGPGGVADSVARQLSRPLQIESVGAAILVTLRHVFGLSVTMESSHGSQNVSGALGNVVGFVMTVVQGALLIWVWVRFARGAMTTERLIRYAAAAVVVFVAFGKVLSPQFLIWLIPLVPLVAGRRGLAASGLLAAALIVTHLWFPFRYWEYARRFDGGVAALVLLRDLLLIALAAVLLREPRGDAVEVDADERRQAPLGRLAQG